VGGTLFDKARAARRSGASFYSVVTNSDQRRFQITDALNKPSRLENRRSDPNSDPAIEAE
jgi:hypothetical protein